jgi:hypothetical protein
MDKRLAEILSTMNIPESRKTDVLWLNRNVGIQNGNHPDFKECIKLLKKEMRER